MRNQDEYIPDYMKLEWTQVREELAIASERRHEARVTHSRAVMARIALGEELAGETYAVAHEQLNNAETEYQRVVAARIALSDELHGRHERTYFENEVAS